jgi:outer membrane receptor for ferrienterochelin and colicin
MYRIPFPEKFEDITEKQALKMNMFMNDMKNNIREAVVVSKTTSPGDAADLAKSANTTVDAVKTAIDQAKKTGDAVTVAELELTNDIGKDDYVDDEGRMAKSQLYKMAKYAVKLHGMLDDMEQLPAWVQAKFTKASDYLSSIYHYLDYEFARRDSDLMREMEKYKEAMLEEPNEISYDDAKKKGLKSPDKADISKDKDISDYELKRGMAIQKAIEKQK